MIEIYVHHPVDPICEQDLKLLMIPYHPCQAQLDI